MKQNLIDSLREKTIDLIHNSPKRSQVDYTNTSEAELLEELNNYHVELQAQNDELELANKRLEDTSVLFDAMFYNAPVGYILLNKRYKILEINSKGLEVLSLNKENFANLRLVNYIGKGEIQKFLDWTLEKEHKTLEIKINASKEIKTVYLDKTYWQNKDEYIFLTITDITVQKEKELFEFERKKIISLTTLLNNIAHHWRQPLTVISLVLNSIILKYKKNDLSKEFLDLKSKKAFDTIAKLSNIIDDFQYIIKDKQQELSVQNIKNIIDETLNEFSNTSETKLIIEGLEELSMPTNKRKLTIIISLMLEHITILLKENETNDLFISSVYKEKNYIVRIKFKGFLQEEVITQLYEPYEDIKYNNHNLSMFYLARLTILQQFNGDLRIENNQGYVETKIILPVT